MARYADARVPVTLLRVGTSDLLVAANPTALARVLANIVDNAVRYATTAVAVSVGSAADGGAVLGVTDDGPGIPAADRARVFERFTRLHDARDRNTGGSGLGLAIVGELVRQQGGSVTLDDKSPGGDPPGLRVEVHLPSHRLDGAVTS